MHTEHTNMAWWISECGHGTKVDENGHKSMWAGGATNTITSDLISLENNANPCQ